MTGNSECFKLAVTEVPRANRILLRNVISIQRRDAPAERSECIGNSIVRIAHVCSLRTELPTLVRVKNREPDIEPGSPDTTVMKVSHSARSAFSHPAKPISTVPKKVMQLALMQFHF